MFSPKELPVVTKLLAGTQEQAKRSQFSRLHFKYRQLAYTSGVLLLSGEATMFPASVLTCNSIGVVLSLDNVSDERHHLKQK